MDENGQNIPFMSKGQNWVEKILRKTSFGRRFFSCIKARTTLGVIRILHKDVIHRIREFSAAATNKRVNAAGQLAIEVCTDSKGIMSKLLELHEDDLRCCLKVFCAGLPKGDDIVATLARSEEFDERVPKDGTIDAHPVGKNSVWSALLGGYDGFASWPRFRCFSCGDLFKHENFFACTRDNWKDYYRSVLVFPIRYMDVVLTRHCTVSGFLAFDSLKKCAFGKLPDIFEWREKHKEYHKILGETSVYHLGALLADTLGIFMRPILVDVKNNQD